MKRSPAAHRHVWALYVKGVCAGDGQCEACRLIIASLVRRLIRCNPYTCRLTDVRAIYRPWKHAGSTHAFCLPPDQAFPFQEVFQLVQVQVQGCQGMMGIASGAIVSGLGVTWTRDA